MNSTAGGAAQYTPMHQQESLSPEIRTEPEVAATKLQRLINLYGELKSITELQADQEKFKQTLDAVTTSSEQTRDEIRNLQMKWTEILDEHKAYISSQKAKPAYSLSTQDLDKLPNPDISESIKQLNANLEPMLVPPANFFN